MKHSTSKMPTYYGLDVHEKTISVSRCTSETKTAEYIKTIVNDTKAIQAFFKTELKKYPVIQSAYEAGAFGYKVHHTLCALGIDSHVVAPTKIPTMRGGGKKNDKLDSMYLAKYLHNGDLTSIYIPEQDQLDMRELTRQRQVFTKQASQAKNQLAAMLRRHGIRYTRGKNSWTKVYCDWLNTLEMPTPTLQMTFGNYKNHVESCLDRVKEVDAEIHALNQKWEKQKVVQALGALRGIGAYTAASIVAEVGQFSRFETAGKFMSYLGLTPNEFSSGERIPGGGVNRGKLKQGGITKAGNARLRWLLVEASWHAHHFPRKSSFKKRWEGLPLDVVAHAWKAQNRLYKKKQSLMSNHKSNQKANIAVARELAGFVWAIGCMMENPQQQRKQVA